VALGVCNMMEQGRVHLITSTLTSSHPLLIVRICQSSIYLAPCSPMLEMEAYGGSLQQALDEVRRVRMTSVRRVDPAGVNPGCV
jgi:hypothetical protein